MHNYSLISLLCLLLAVFPARLFADTPIMGVSEVSPERMAEFVLQRNPDFDPSIAYAFHQIGADYGIRGDIAFCQAIIETGWFRFSDGTAVKSSQYNFGGIGVLQRGQTGNSFESLNEGVEAMIQHIYAYCTKAPLPEGRPLLDPRFSLVSRGIAPMWEGLSNRWAMNPNYAKSFLALYEQMRGTGAKDHTPVALPHIDAALPADTIPPDDFAAPRRKKPRKKQVQTIEVDIPDAFFTPAGCN
ncbi:MAG: glucosaminidase domain-containing protein [Muribaculaceae bacterium]|nr:glucosaminidase domain-containing protein [Muribaculaceae bacterium]